MVDGEDEDTDNEVYVLRSRKQQNIKEAFSRFRGQSAHRIFLVFFFGSPSPEKPQHTKRVLNF